MSDSHDINSAAAPAPSTHEIDFRTTLALVMVVVAVFGAIVVFRGAYLEQQTAEDASKLVQGRLVEMIERQQILSLARAREELADRRAGLLRFGVSRMDNADRMRSTMPDQASRLDLLAQEEIAAARAVMSIASALPVFPEAVATQDDELQRVVSAHLAALGFETQWPDPRRADAQHDASPGGGVDADPSATPARASMWSRVERRIDTGHALAPALALVVTGFVLALVILTLTDVFAGPRSNRLSFACGAFVAVGCAVAAVALDPIIWRGFAIAAAVFAVFFALTRLFKMRGPRVREHGFLNLPLLGGNEFAGAHVHQHHASNAFSRFTIVAIAVTALFSAVAAWWYSDAAAASDRAAERALAQEVEMSTRTLHREVIVLRSVAELADTVEGRARRAAISQRIGSIPSSWLALSDQNDLARIRSEARTAYVDFDLDDPWVGIEADARFPLRLIYDAPWAKPADSQWIPFALWDAAASESTAWHHKTTYLLLTLTLFAIALYFFGQALSMGWSVAAAWLVCGGIAFALSGVSVGLYDHFSPVIPSPFQTQPSECRDEQRFGPLPTETTALAAMHYALAKRSVFIAADAADHAQVVEHLRCVVALRPDFKQARIDLVIAAARSDSVEAANGIMSLPALSNLASLTELESGAIQQMQTQKIEPAAELLGEYAFLRFLQLLANGPSPPDDLDRVVRLARNGIEAASKSGNPSKSQASQFQFNLGVMLLAAGDVKAAEEAYDNGLREMPWADAHLVAATLTDLETLSARCSRIADADRCVRIRTELPRIKERLVAATLPPTRGARGARSVGLVGDGFDLEVSSSRLKANAVLSDFDPARDRINIVWYAFVPEWLSWRALQESPAAIDPRSLRVAPGGHIYAMRSALFDSAGTDCLSDASYRAELYVNGRLLKSREVKSKSPALESTRFHRLNVQLCRPKTWLRWSEVDIPHDDSLLNGFVTPDNDHAHAAFLYTHYAPRPEGWKTNQARGKEIAKVLLASLATEHLISGQERVQAYEGLAECKANLTPGSLMYGTWTEIEGTVHVAIALADAGPAAEICEMLASAESISWMDPAAWRVQEDVFQEFRPAESARRH